VLVDELRDEGLAGRAVDRVDDAEPRAKARSMRLDWVRMRILRLSKRSAMRPVIGTSTSWGPNCSAMVAPTATASLSVRSVRTTQFWVVACIHAPTFDTRAPMNQMR
jgi:hypothetical protein